MSTSDMCAAIALYPFTLGYSDPILLKVDKRSKNGIVTLLYATPENAILANLYLTLSCG